MIILQKYFLFAYNTPMNIDEFRLRLKRCGLTQMELSRRTGIPQATLSRFLSGREIRGRHVLTLMPFVQFPHDPTFWPLPDVPAPAPAGEGALCPDPTSNPQGESHD